MTLRTQRLELIAADRALAHAAAEDTALLGRLVEAHIAPDWPPEYLADALPFFAAQTDAPHHAPEWGMYFVVLVATPGSPRTLIGTVGCKSRPTAEGQVEVGYGIVGSMQRRGLATEATRALVDWVLSHAAVRRVVAHTFERHEGSIGVLRNCGFTLAGPGFEKVDESERQGRGELVLYERLAG